MIEQTTAKKTGVGNRTLPQVIFSNKELLPITTMYFQLTVNKTGKFSFSGFSVGSCTNERKVICYQLGLENNLLTFRLNAPVVIRVKVRRCKQTLPFIAMHY